MFEVEANKCYQCGNPVSGRSDKRYCSDRCRGIYNNQRRARASFRFIRNVNNALYINRNILASLIEASNNKTSPEVLQQMGFNFKYHTHIFQSKTGKTYHYCYDYGYLQIEADKFLIVKSNA